MVMYNIIIGGMSTSAITIHCKNRIVSMTCSLSFHLHVSEPITHMGTDNFIMKEQVTLIPLHFDVFVQIMITAV